MNYQTLLSLLNSRITLKLQLRSRRNEKILDAFPRSAHPMGVLSTLTSALTAFNPRAVNVKSKEDLDHAAEMLIAKFAHLCAWTYRKTNGFP